MKIFKITGVLSVLMLMISCGSVSNQEANAEGFGAIESELKSEFGDNAFYTDLTIGYEKSVGNIINVTVTDAPESMVMGEWLMMQGVWEQKAEIKLEVSEGSKAADFMFQLNDEISLSKLGELVEKSIGKLKEDKEIENPTLNLAFVKFPDDGDITKANYTIMLEPENGGTTFTYSYELSGELIDMSY